jgi:hypothetical protein
MGAAIEAVPAKPPANTSADADTSDISLLLNMCCPLVLLESHPRRLAKRLGPFTGRMLPLVCLKGSAPPRVMASRFLISYEWCRDPLYLTLASRC